MAFGIDRPGKKYGQIQGAELSASIPVQDGLAICPGAMLLRRRGETVAGIALQSTWRF